MERLLLLKNIAEAVIAVIAVTIFLKIYQKFLYDYECEKEGLSSPADLQQAIDGNRREGRRSTSSNSNFPQIGYSLSHHNPSSLLNKRSNGSLNFRNGHYLLQFTDDPGLGPSASQQAAFVAAYRAEQIAALQAHQRQLEKAQRAAVEAASRQTYHASLSGRESTSSVDSDGTPAKRPRRSSESKNDTNEENCTGCTNEQSTDRLFDTIPSAHLKITSRGVFAQTYKRKKAKPLIVLSERHRTNSTKSSLVVSMEINGIMYQGVLFALNPSLQVTTQEDAASDTGDGNSITNSLKIAL
ncbi:unnamed protein product [Enterobius vermicularis]|uniref:REKLES domain-containing protein n=1 Tax=Enterobius vermicularis TaxID=51028 RepID=A0A0N4VR19_ENTVE|nr:unnamed protein product [Enterobius vermicularis]